MSAYLENAEQWANKICASIDAGAPIWRKGWDTRNCFDAFAPVNPSSHARYSGFNCVVLGCTALTEGYKSSRWLTYNQASELGGFVKKGSKGVKCFKYGTYTPKKKGKESEKKDETDKEDKAHGYMKSFTVFNVDQIEGLPPDFYPTTDAPTWSWKPEEKAEEILNGSGAKIHYKEQGRAFYSLETDSITLPLREQFHNAVAFYDTALHELGHWTGAKNRLNRNLENCLGVQNRAREELRAEIASYMMASRLGIPHDARNHDAYLASWSEILKEKPREILEACTDAEKICNYLLDLAKKKPTKTIETAEQLALI